MINKFEQIRMENKNKKSLNMSVDNDLTKQDPGIIKLQKLIQEEERLTDQSEKLLLEQIKMQPGMIQNYSVS